MPRKALGQRQHSCYPKIFQLATRKEGSERPQDIAGYQVLLDQRDAEIARQSAELSARDLLIEKKTATAKRTARAPTALRIGRLLGFRGGGAAFAAAGESCLYEILANPIDGVAIGVPLSTIIGIELWFASGLHRLTRPDLSSHDVRPDVSGQEPHGIKARSSRQRWSDAFKKRTVAEASHLVTTIQLRTPDDSS